MNNPENPEPNEIIYQAPSWLGKGYDRYIKVHPSLWLCITDIEQHDDYFIPQSIQVIPQEVLRDQNANNLNEALRNAPELVFRVATYSLAMGHRFGVGIMALPMTNNLRGLDQSLMPIRSQVFKACQS